MEAFGYKICELFCNPNITAVPSVRCKGDVTIVVLLVVSWFLLYLSIIMTLYDVLLFRSVKVKLLSVASNTLAALDDDDIATSCALTPHTGWITVSHEIDSDVAQTSVTMILPSDGGPVTKSFHIAVSLLIKLWTYVYHVADMAYEILLPTTVIVPTLLFTIWIWSNPFTSWVIVNTHWYDDWL